MFSHEIDFTGIQNKEMKEVKIKVLNIGKFVEITLYLQNFFHFSLKRISSCKIYNYLCHDA